MPVGAVNLSVKEIEGSLGEKHEKYNPNKRHAFQHSIQFGQ